jgi:hypothetical protein
MLVEGKGREDNLVRQPASFWRRYVPLRFFCSKIASLMICARFQRKNRAHSLFTLSPKITTLSSFEPCN